jgi:hypothetical protein
MRKFLVPAALAAALLVPSAAVAGGHDGNNPVVNPLPSRVTDEASAETFAQAYVLRNGARIAGVNQFNGRDDYNGRNRDRDRNRNRVTVSDAAAACLQHPVIAARFGCIVRFNVEVRDSYTFARAAKTHGRDPVPAPRNRDRVRSLGCLAALRINGGPSVTPSVTVAFADCVQRRTLSIPTPY